MIGKLAKKLDNLAEDYRACWLGVRAAREDADEIMQSIKERIESGKQRDAVRIAELDAICSDPDRSDTVKRVAQMESKQLKAVHYEVTEEEKAAHEEALGQWRQAVYDAQQAKKELESTLEAVAVELKQIREKTVNCGIYNDRGEFEKIANAANKLDRLVNPPEKQFVGLQYRCV